MLLSPLIGLQITTVSSFSGDEIKEQTSSLTWNLVNESKTKDNLQSNEIIISDEVLTDDEVLTNEILLNTGSENNKDAIIESSNIEENLIDTSDIEADIINILKTETGSIDESSKIDELIVIDIKYFYVTAYYSPLPWQKRYITWSYEWDIKLNWWWKKSASWKKVFDGLLAAPSNYKFWTKIELEWIWVWEVADRWWAIVKWWEGKNEYDRIDIWMWYWDEWLYRSMKYWKRKVAWKVVPSNTEISIKFKHSPVIKYDNLIVDAKNPKKEDVIELQNLLTEVNIYSWKIDGNFDSVKDVLVKYQIENNIISWKEDPETAYFWNKTMAVLREEFWWDIFENTNNKIGEDIFLDENIKNKLNLLNNKITYFIDSKYWKNTPNAIKYRASLKMKIDKQTKKEKTNLRKNQLKYLKSII